MTFQEAICNQMVAGHPDQHYGTQRMYASAGWGVSAMIVGHLMDRASSKSLLSDYTLGFEVMLVAWLADAVAISFMKVHSSFKANGYSPKMTVNATALS